MSSKKEIIAECCKQFERVKRSFEIAQAEFRIAAQTMRRIEALEEELSKVVDDE